LPRDVDGSVFLRAYNGPFSLFFWLGSSLGRLYAFS
jgi:hypothetical protein